MTFGGQNHCPGASRLIRNRFLKFPLNFHETGSDIVGMTCHRLPSTTRHATLPLQAEVAALGPGMEPAHVSVMMSVFFYFLQLQREL